MIRDMPPGAGGVLAYFTRHRTLANLLLLLMLLLGFAAIPNMRAQFFPDVILDNVRVNVAWEGAGPEDIDSGVVEVLEPALLIVEGVESTSSTSRQGSATIVLDFEPDWDMSRAVEDVRTALDQVNNLPADAEDPVVRRGAWRDRVTDVVITGPVDPAQLALYADELVVRLFAEGVTRTTIRGIADPETVVEVPTAKLIEHGVSMADIAQAIEAEVDADPAGDVDSANARVSTGVEKRSAVQIGSIVLRSNPDGSKLVVSDVARVLVSGVDRERSYFVGSNPAISIRVDRSAQGDAIEVQSQVEAVAQELELTLPSGVQIDLIRTRSEAITSRLNILIDNGLMGLGLVVALLFLFLNARTAFWVAAGIPVAMLAAIALMYAAGLTINMISLFGLIITLGIVVDDAIVVGEHADFRARTLGEHPVVAAENAARRMAMPVFAATLTTIIAFFGLLLVGGRFGDLIRDIPFTVIVVLAASLIECFLILPNHMAHALSHSAKEHWYDVPSRIVNRGFVWVRETLFRPFVGFAVRARYAVIAGALALLSVQVGSFLVGDVNWRFFNAPERGSISGNFAMVEGATREDTLAMMQEMQRAVEATAAGYEAEYGTNPVAYVVAEVGGNSGRGLALADSKSPDQLGGIAIELIDADLRPYSSFAFLAELQDNVQRQPLVEALSWRSWRSGPASDALDVQFYGADTTTLKAASQALQTALIRFPEVSALEDDLAYDKQELILDLTAQGQALGFTTDMLGRTLRHRLGGIKAAEYPDGLRSATIRVELPESELTADFLERTQLRAPSGVYVPLADIVSVTQRDGFSTLRRENGLKVVSVSGDISEDDAQAAEAVMEALEQEILPEIASTYQVEWQLSGLSEDEDSFLSDSMTGLALCLAGIYLVLAWIFASWSRPLVIMVIIPFGLVGTIYGHAQWDIPMSMFTVVGLLGMTGIIINDSIVLVTTIDEYAKDRGLIPSIIDGTVDRLRPVMLTTLTTVLGLTPLLYETSQQAQFLKPTVITLVYGLGFGMVLVLLLVPAMIAVGSDMARPIQSLRRALRAGSPASAMRPLLAGAGALLLGWMALTIGPHLGLTLPEVLPRLAEGSGAALGLFMLGAIVILGTLYAGAAASRAWQARRG